MLAEAEGLRQTGDVSVSRPVSPATPPVAQPYTYRAPELHEPDWRRLPGWRDVTAAEWASAQWQRSHCVKSVTELRAVWGDLVDDAFYADLEADQQQMATMAMLIPPQMLNTIVPDATPDLAQVMTDPVRRYMLPVRSDRHPTWPSHPHASRDSLHEAEMWGVEGLTHRYPTKVLAELVPTCPQYCGHCTRMDLVGTSVPQVTKHKLTLKPTDRYAAMLAYLAEHTEVRDVVVSGGDVANVPWPRLEAFLMDLLALPNIRDIRLATKALMGLPQHWSSDEVRAGVERVARLAASRNVGLAVHTHVNAAQSVTPAVAQAVRALLDAGVRDVRNQGVLMRGVNDTPDRLLDLCFSLMDGAAVTPYYFYLCDMIPNAEHWRTSLRQAQDLQKAIMGWLPGFATPRIVCDVPYVGKRWVHQVDEYDEVRGVSWWSKSYRTQLDATDAEALTKRFPYYDPIDTLPEIGQAWWVEPPAPHTRKPLQVV